MRRSEKNKIANLTKLLGYRVVYIIMTTLQEHEYTNYVIRLSQVNPMTHTDYVMTLDSLKGLG